MTVEVGDVIADRFVLAEHGATGGMGVVFRAIDRSDGRNVAVKLLQGHTDHEVERARREAAALERISHPAIVRYIADGTLPTGEAYVVMDWLEGTTLAERLATDGITLRDAVAVARRIATALAAGHRIDILHRDVKPANVLLVADNAERAMLIDFGLAHVADPVIALTKTGAAVGTPGYMSPEQARGVRGLGPAADVFGLGCVLYECATGRPAFAGTYAAAVLAKILFAEPLPFANYCPEAPPALAALIEHMLAKQAGDRIADCDAVVAALDALGTIPDGPRRTTSAVHGEVTAVSPPPAGPLRCLVGAALGNLDDVIDPPDDAQRAQLVAVCDAHGGQLEVLATGAVLVLLVGDAADVARRGAEVALAARAILPERSIAISSLVGDTALVAEVGAALLARASLAALFKRSGGPAIVVGDATAKLLADHYEVADVGSQRRLLGRRT